MPSRHAPTLPLVGHAREVTLPSPLESLERLGGAGQHVFLRYAGAGGFRGVPWSFLAAEPETVLRVGRLWGGRALGRHLGALGPSRVTREGPHVPFAGGWAGMVGYEARSGVEDRPPSRRPPLGFPALWLGRYGAVLAWNHRRKTAYVAGVGSTMAAARRKADRLLAGLSKRRAKTRAVTVRPRARASAVSYRRAVSAAKRAVRSGEIFQVNVSHRFDATFQGSPLDLFARLAEAQPAPYMTYLDLGDGRAVLSASPERFVRVVRRVAETDPMKGTRPRGATRAEDRRLRAELEDCEKERAELAMIVDLSRNDLARACVPGSVRVVVPRRLLRFVGVHQAIGVVRGRLRRGKSRVDLLQAMFPPGSVTGAPKVRAMEILDELEGEGRGPYCGALGWFDEAGDMDLAVAIRTIVVGGKTASYRVGSGITLRSDPQAEWEETLAKGRGLSAALTGAEDGA